MSYQIDTINNLDQYTEHTDKFESLYTIIMYHTTGQEFTNYIQKLLDKLKCIKDSVKRKYYTGF